VVSGLQKGANLIQLVYCSDSFAMYETEYKQMARFVFRVPVNDAERAEFDLLLKTVFRLIDLFVSVSLPPARLIKSRAARKKLQSVKSKVCTFELFGELFIF
jgi:hypothetical protein